MPEMREVLQKSRVCSVCVWDYVGGGGVGSGGGGSLLELKLCSFRIGVQIFCCFQS